MEYPVKQKTDASVQVNRKRCLPVCRSAQFRHENKLHNKSTVGDSRRLENSDFCARHLPLQKTPLSWEANPPQNGLFQRRSSKNRAIKIESTTFFLSSLKKKICWCGIGVLQLMVYQLICAVAQRGQIQEEASRLNRWKEKWGVALFNKFSKFFRK